MGRGSVRIKTQGRDEGHKHKRDGCFYEIVRKLRKMLLVSYLCGDYVRTFVNHIMTRDAWEVEVGTMMLIICSFVAIFWEDLVFALSLVRMCHGRSRLYIRTFCSFYFSHRFSKNLRKIMHIL